MREVRRHLLDLMRIRGGLTVEEAARELGLTRTAAVNHLKSLMGEGLVRRGGLRRGTRRPSVVHSLTADADRLFPQRYEEFARDIVAEVERLRSPHAKRVLRGVGDRWIARDAPALQGLRSGQRFDRALEIMAERGFMPALQRTASSVTLRQFNCPLRRLCAGSTDVRGVILRWIQALFGAPTRRVECICEGASSCAYKIGR